jgi:hypothetical protein
MAKYLHTVSCESLLFKKGSGLKRLWQKIMEEDQKILPLLGLECAVFSNVGKTAFAEPADNSKQDNKQTLGD